MLKDRNNKSFQGFTLVEVLITLGIIGVVAAITIPLLIQNSNSKKFITQFEKSLSTLNQAAINAQAQYDMDYSLLGSTNQDSACATDALSKGQDTLCGLLNNTLSGHTYQGKYGVVKGANNSTPYQADVSSFPITDFLVFSFADGAFVAFNPNAVNCSLAPSSVISTEMVTSGNLANCLGFVDVNGSQFPNKEVKCFEEDTELSVYSTCKVTNRSMGDIFPIVFYDGVVKPITNASLSVMLGGDAKGSSGGDSTANNPLKKITYDGHEWTLGANGFYFREDDNGNLVYPNGNTFTKQADGSYLGSDGSGYDSNMSPSYKIVNGEKYDYNKNSGYYLKKDGDNYVRDNGQTFVKQADGTYKRTANSGNEVYYDSNLNPVYAIKNGERYDNIGVRLLKQDGDKYTDTSGHIYTKQADGTYVMPNPNNPDGSNWYYDSNGKRNHIIDKNGVRWEVKSSDIVIRKDGDRYIDANYSRIYTKREDGLYECTSGTRSVGTIYDEDFNVVYSP